MGQVQNLKILSRLTGTNSGNRFANYVDNFNTNSNDMDIMSGLHKVGHLFEFLNFLRNRVTFKKVLSNSFKIRLTNYLLNIGVDLDFKL